MRPESPGRARPDRHVLCEPPILYFGTPVVIIGSLNEDGTTNLAPMSSAFWLGWRGMLGLAAASKTAQNLRRTRQAVLNLPSDAQVAAVDRLALTTGVDPVPAYKASRGYRFVADKFAVAGLTPEASLMVRPQRVRECPVQLEAIIEAEHAVGADEPSLQGRIVTFEARICRVHVSPALLVPGERDRIDPDPWRPLLMSFQKFFGLTAGQVAPSRLSSIPEAVYRSADLDRAAHDARRGGMDA